MQTSTTILLERSPEDKSQVPVQYSFVTTSISIMHKYINHIVMAVKMSVK